MRTFLNHFSSAPRFFALLLGSAFLLVAPGAGVAGNDILLPAEDAPPPADNVATPDPSALVAPVDPSAQAQAEDAMDELLKKIDNGAQKVQEPPPAVPEVVPETADTAPPPANTGLAAPAGAGGLTPEPPEAATDVPAVSALPADQSADENLFFDADTLVPTGEMGSSAPRKVNPALQPASKLIVVKKDYGPGSRQAQMVSAERAVALGRYDSALDIYDTMYKKNSRDPNIVMGRAVALQHLGRVDEAVSAYEELLDLRPDNVQAQINMLGLIGQRYPAVALQRLGSLRDKNPNDVSIVGQMAVLEASLGQYDEAVKSLGVAASLEPNNASHIYNMAVVSDLAGKKQDAIRLYEQALEVDSIYGGNRSIPRDAVFERLARLR